MAGSANSDSTRVFEQIALEILAEVCETDEAEDREHGNERGDELPEQLRTPEGRREFFADAKSGEEPAAGAQPQFEFDEQRIVSRTRSGGVAARRRPTTRAHRWTDPDPVPPHGQSGCYSPRSGSSRSSRQSSWQPGIRAVPRAASEDRWASPRRSTEALPATGGAGRQGERDRSRQQTVESA
jgi:hypothetical protein